MSEITNKKPFDKEKLFKTVGKTASEYNFVLIFVAILCVYLIMAGSGSSWAGTIYILRQSSQVGVIALGMGIVIITKGIDLSVGSMMALVGVLAAVVFNNTDSVVLLILTCLVGGALCGFFNGILIGKGKLPPFIVTLATMLMFRSIASFLSVEILGLSYLQLTRTDARTALYNFGNGSLFTIPVSGLILIGITVIMVIVVTKTKYGKSLYAVGSNEKAARLAGINVDWVIVSTYTITGLLVGVAAFLQLSMWTALTAASTGSSYEMYAIAAVVIGGISMSGGKGKIVGVLFGAMAYGVIDNIITTAGANARIQDAIKGAILLLAIAVQVIIPAVRTQMDNAKARKESLLAAGEVSTETPVELSEEKSAK